MPRQSGFIRTYSNSNLQSKTNQFSLYQHQYPNKYTTNNYVHYQNHKQSTIPQNKLYKIKSYNDLKSKIKTKKRYKWEKHILQSQRTQQNYQDHKNSHSDSNSAVEIDNFAYNQQSKHTYQNNPYHGQQHFVGEHYLNQPHEQYINTPYEAYKTQSYDQPYPRQSYEQINQRYEQGYGFEPQTRVYIPQSEVRPYNPYTYNQTFQSKNQAYPYNATYPVNCHLNDNHFMAGMQSSSQARAQTQTQSPNQQLQPQIQEQYAQTNTQDKVNLVQQPFCYTFKDHKTSHSIYPNQTQNYETRTQSYSQPQKAIIMRQQRERNPFEQLQQIQQNKNSLQRLSQNIDLHSIKDKVNENEIQAKIKILEEKRQEIKNNNNKNNYINQHKVQKGQRIRTDRYKQGKETIRKPIAYEIPKNHFILSKQQQEQIEDKRMKEIINQNNRKKYKITKEDLLHRRELAKEFDQRARRKVFGSK